MKTKQLLLAAAASLSLCMTTIAQAKVTVSDAWARATVTGQTMGGAFLTLTNDSDHDAALISVATDAADHAEMHVMQESNGMMQMVQTQRIEIPAHQSVTLAPKGTHIMLMGLNKTLTEGNVIGLKLKMNDNGRINRIRIKAPVRALGGMHSMEGMSH